MINIKKLSQMWNYFKKGRGEIGLVLSLYSMMLSYSIKFDVNFSLVQYAIVTLVFGVICTFLGVFLAQKVEPENNRISPYAQDSLQGAICLQESLIAFYEGDKDTAIGKMQEAVALRKKWLK